MSTVLEAYVRGMLGARPAHASWDVLGFLFWKVAVADLIG